MSIPLIIYFFSAVQSKPDARRVYVRYVSMLMGGNGMWLHVVHNSYSQSLSQTWQFISSVTRWY